MAVTERVNLTEPLPEVPGGGVSPGFRTSPRVPVPDSVQVTAGWLWSAFPPPLARSKVTSVWFVVSSWSELLNAVGTR